MTSNFLEQIVQDLPTEYAASQYAPAVPIEDLAPGCVVHNSQLLPTATINVANVYELAFLGLSDRGISGKLRIPPNIFPTHFSKTVAQARADAATDHLLRLQETANGDFKPNALQHDATKYLLDKRLDPQPKDPVVTIEQVFKGLDVTSISVNEANDL